MCTNCMNSSATPGNPGPARPVVTSPGSIVQPAAPLASPIDFAPDDDDPIVQPNLPASPLPLTPLPPLKLCHLDFRGGCYAITFRPSGSLSSFEGTLRVDRAAPDGGADKMIVSGDLYKRGFVLDPFTPVPFPTPILDPGPLVAPPPSPGGAGGGGTAVALAPSPATLAAAVSMVNPMVSPFIPLKPQIPIFPRGRYHSYLKVTKITVPFAATTTAGCQVTLIAEQFNYSPPPTGSFKGTFPASPSRTVTIKLRPATAPFPYSLTGGPYFEGRLLEGGVDKGSFTAAWVSPFFRRATIEIDVLAGAVAPAPVPNGSGGTDFFDTIFARTGWLLKIINSQTNIPVPAGVVATDCWSSANLHALMTANRGSADLDSDWRLHFMIVPAKLGCARGVMYDQIGVPREGCASFSDDGYPTADSPNFGAAANKKQRNVPRAYLRSAAHEITHTFNQIHQEQETSADNSIMTTTPSVANVLGGPATGAPGVFPDQIDLNHNATVRRHLNHMPDPVIRPGGWPFGSWFPSGAPQAADRNDFSPAEVDLEVTCSPERVSLGQPVDLAWTMTNTSGVPLLLPNDISTESLNATITVTDGNGREQTVRPFVIRCESAALEVLQPGDSVSASSRVFWSSSGFAFERPGRYQVSVTLAWATQGVMIGATDSIDVFVDSPIQDTDNQAAGLVMHPEVGKWVALGGDAYHLPEACRRLYQLAVVASGDSQPRVMDGFSGLMPDMGRIADLYPEYADQSGDSDGGNGGGRPRRSRRPRRR